MSDTFAADHVSPEVTEVMNAADEVTARLTADGYSEDTQQPKPRSEWSSIADRLDPDTIKELGKWVI